MDDRSRMDLQTMQKTALIKRHLTLIFANIYRPNTKISFSKYLSTKYNYLFLMADVLKLFNCHLLFWYTTLSPNVFIHCFSVFWLYFTLFSRLKSYGFFFHFNCVSADLFTFPITLDQITKHWHSSKIEVKPLIKRTID